MDYVILGLSIATLLVSIIVLILFSKNSQKPVDSEQAQQIGKIESKIENISGLVTANVSLSLKEEMVRILKELNEQSNRDSEKLERFERNINEAINGRFVLLNEQIEKKLTEINSKVEERLGKGFENTTQTFQDVLVRLTKIDEAQKNIEALSGDVVDLKTVLTGNQSRGAYGEFTLNSILRNIFGDTNNLYELQYLVKQGTVGEIRPDAVVFLPDPNKLICIDSKFPYSGYQELINGSLKEAEKQSFLRDFRAAVKKHIKTVAEKYIIEGYTSPQALLFIPNDGMFAFVHITYPDLIEEARRINVIITSPATLQPILSTINLIRIQYERSKKVDEISRHIAKLQTEFRKFGSDWAKFSSSVDTLAKSKENFNSRVNLMDRNFGRIAASEIEINQDLVANDVEIE